MEFIQNKNGSLFKVAPDEYEYLIDLIRESNPKEDNKQLETYTQEDFLKEVYMSEEDYTKLRSLLQNKKNIILQGAPGVGKTFSAKDWLTPWWVKRWIKNRIHPIPPKL